MWHLQRAVLPLCQAMVDRRACGLLQHPAHTDHLLSVAEATRNAGMIPLATFQRALSAAQNVVVLTGAGVSAESGIPTFRGAGGLWRSYDATSLATPEAFVANPSLVWEFYSWRREVVQRCLPNPAHYAIAALQRKLGREGRRLTLVTQNVDRLHQQAGSGSVVELHGSIWDVCRATRSGLKDPRCPCWEDRTQPLVPALAGKGQPDPNKPPADIPLHQLPHDTEGRLLRPGVVLFGEALPSSLEAAEDATAGCDMFITVGTSAVVYPAAGLAGAAAVRGVPVAEFNLEQSGSTGLCSFAFQGKAGELLPAAFGVEEEVAQLMGG